MGRANDMRTRRLSEPNEARWPELPAQTIVIDDTHYGRVEDVR